MIAVATQLASPVIAKPAPAVVVRHLQKLIDDHQVLHDVNFSAEAGEYVAILGTNGAGKSTLLKIFAGLTSASGGETELFGQAMGGTAACLRQRIGLIDHQPLLYRDLTAAENLEFFARLYGLANPRQRALRMLERFGLAARATDPVKAFSRGMVQRVAIARALLHDPELILADEPFAGLDAPSVESLEHLFSELAAAGKTILLVNHDLEQTLRIVDRIVVLRHGTIVLDQPTHRIYLDELRAEVSAA